MSDIKIAPFVLDETFLPILRDLMLRNGGRVTDENLISYFQPRAMIPPFARRKGIVKANDTDYIEDAEVDEMALYNYGISVPMVEGQSPRSLYTKVIEEFFGLGFFYHRPRGGTESPYRISDFCGYWPNAIAPMKIILPTRVAYITEPSEANDLSFGLTILNLNDVVGLADDVVSANKYHAVPAGPPIWPSASGTSGWRGGVYMKLSGYDTTEGVDTTIEAVAFGGFTYLSVRDYFAGSVVEMLPIQSNMPEEIIPSNQVVFGINESDWANVITYALPDGVIEVEFDSPETLGSQTQYSKGRVIDFWGQYYDSNKDSVFAKLVIENGAESVIDPITSLTIAIVKDGIEEFEQSQTFYPSWGQYPSTFTVQFDSDRTFIDYHIELWWDGKRQRSVKIREAL